MGITSFVENGKNPDLFTQGFVERTASENQFTYGKVKAVNVSYGKSQMDQKCSWISLVGIQEYSC